ncbi:MAG: DNA repair protein RecO [Synechococcales cyanobacterium]
MSTHQRGCAVTGIILKSMPLGESDKLLTLLTQELGVIRAVAKGSRKTPSKWGGRTELFICGEWFVSQGRWQHPEQNSQKLYRLSDGDIRHAFRGLSRRLEPLLAAQYLAEVALLFMPAGHAQPDLYVLLLEHLHRLETAPPDQVLPLLTHGVYHLLAWAGVAPQVFQCHYCRCHPPLRLEIGFSLTAGGIICDTCCERQRPYPLSMLSEAVWTTLQYLPPPTLTVTGIPQSVWVRVERVLRRLVEFHAERSIQSAALLAQMLDPLEAVINEP